MNFKLSIWILLLITSSIFVMANNPGDYTDTTQTWVNITNSYPIIKNVILPAAIELNPGTNKSINCTVEAYDWNGWNDITLVNATFFDADAVTSGAVDDNSTHYTNTNCTFGATAGLYNRTFHCGFTLEFYANPGSSWTCNVTIMDRQNFTNQEYFTSGNITPDDYNTTTMNNLYALNVTSIIDFGQAMVGDTVTNKTSNVTNFGNVPINVSVDAYGVSDGDGLAMTCDIGNIPLNTSASNNLRYSANTLDSWAAKVGVTDILAEIPSFTVPVINDTIRGTTAIWHSVFWDLHIPRPSNPSGVCNGTVTFTAVAG